MAKNPQSIKLVSPLPWFSRSGRTGFVTEIFTDCLLLQLFDDQKCLEVQDEITVSLPPGHIHYVFEGGVTKDGRSSNQIMHVRDDVKLADLLGQIRKNQHIEICRSEDVEARNRYTGFDEINFVVNALSELDESELDLSVNFLNRTFAAPLLVTGMTGGIDKGREINLCLARAASQIGIPMGVGSQRLALENSKYAEIFKVKDEVPDLFLIGNLGIAQLREHDAPDQVMRAVDMIDADAIAIHVNILQECIQVEGDRNFSGIFSSLEQICKKSPVPVMLKEVGCGVDPRTVKRLKEVGISAIDVGGSGGTSWGYIEGLRSPSVMTKALGETFRDWGIPTAHALAAARLASPDVCVVATGGIRDGVMVAKACGLGATMAGVGLPLLRAALESQDAVVETLLTYIQGLKIVMMTTGAKRLEDLSEHLCMGRPLESDFRRYLARLTSSS